MFDHPRYRSGYILANLGIQSFALNFVGGNSFAVLPSKISTTSVQFQFFFTPSVWSSIKVSFLASCHPHVQVGNFQVGIICLIQLIYNSEAETAMDAP